jgi:fido (protein-threonine AMPylation protein)
MFDVDILYFLGPRPENDHYRIARAIADGSVLADRIIYDYGAFPVDSAKFLNLLKQLHSAIFGAAVPSIAGRFRELGETAMFGGVATHKLTGTTPQFIERELIKAHRLLVARGIATQDVDQTATTMAIFLEEFFRIHPFCDGNGRLGRLIIQFACESSGLYYMERFNTVGKSRRRYLRALEYAHKHAPRSTHIDKKLAVRNPFRGLARWIAQHLIQRTGNEDIEAEPPQNEGPSENADVIAELLKLEAKHSQVE